MSQEINQTNSKPNAGESSNRGSQNRPSGRNYYKNNRRRRPSNNQYPKSQGAPEDGSTEKVSSVQSDVHNSNRKDFSKPQNTSGNSNNPSYGQNNRNRRPNRSSQEGSGNRSSRGPRDSQEKTSALDSNRRDGSRQRVSQDHRSRERRHDDRKPRPRTKEFHPIETYEDIRKENERLEKEIWIEIASIHMTKLD